MLGTKGTLSDYHKVLEATRPFIRTPKDTYFRGGRANLSVRPKLILPPQRQLLDAALVGRCAGSRHTDSIPGAKVSASPVIFPFATLAQREMGRALGKHEIKTASSVIVAKRPTCLIQLYCFLKERSG